MYTTTEANYFYWHCRTAALIIEQLEHNTATLSHAQRAIRLASETARGKNGVQYASRAANALKPSSRAHWSGLGLIKEHVVPVSVLAKRIMQAHGSGENYTWRDLIEWLTQEDLRNWQVEESDYLQEQRAPFSAVVAAIVRRYTVLAWITREEDKALKARGLTKTLSTVHESDELGRYKECGIELVPLLSAAAA